MGEKQSKPFQLSFNGSLKVDFQGSRVTSDGGLILVRELDERLGFGKLIEEHLTDSRQGTNKKFPLADLVRQSVYTRISILALARPQYTPALPRIPRLFALNPAHHLRR